MKIDQGQLRTAIIASVSEIFEAMVFAMVAPAEYSLVEKPAEEKLMRTSISVKTPITGQLHLQVPEKFAVHITKDIFGWMEEEDPPEKMVQDTLAELINTIIGRLMAKLIPENETFELGLPEISEGWITPTGSAQAISFEFDEHGFTIIIEGDLTTGEE